MEQTPGVGGRTNERLEWQCSTERLRENGRVNCGHVLARGTEVQRCRGAWQACCSESDRWGGGEDKYRGSKQARPHQLFSELLFTQARNTMVHRT